MRTKTEEGICGYTKHIEITGALAKRNNVNLHRRIGADLNQLDYGVSLTISLMHQACRPSSYILIVLDRLRRACDANQKSRYQGSQESPL